MRLFKWFRKNKMALMGHRNFYLVIVFGAGQYIVNLVHRCTFKIFRGGGVVDGEGIAVKST